MLLLPLAPPYAHGRWKGCLTGLALALASSARSGAAADPAEAVQVYFGAGCFWHVQHEFILAEERLLGRSAASELTAISGYAGGSSVNGAGKACYGDYSGLGHTEVVGLRIPRSSVSAFAAVYWGLFVGKNRVDTMDVGAAYRSAVGLPGGIASPLLAEVSASQQGHVAQPFTLREGKGNDPDTLGQALVWVYDSDRFPFHQAEVYHQFHDDFMPGGDYSSTYNALQAQLLSACVLRPTGCAGDTAAAAPGCTVSANPNTAMVGQAANIALSGGSGGSGGSGSFNSQTMNGAQASSACHTRVGWLVAIGLGIRGITARCLSLC